jgi:hypothetical protein
VNLRDSANRLVGRLQRWCRAADPAKVALVAAPPATHGPVPIHGRPGRTVILPATPRRAICVPYRAGSGGAWWSLTVTRATVTCAASSIGGDRTNGKDGVAGSIPAGGSTYPLTSANAGHCGVR